LRVVFQTNSSCVECNTGYFLHNKTCIDCRDNEMNCSKCSTTDEKCTECTDGFFPRNGRCISCNEIGCQTTSEYCNSSSGYCTGCLNGFYPLIGLCKPCDFNEGCALCDVYSNKCEVCKSKYFKNSSALCQLCSSNFCDECDKQTGVCLSCIEGYYLEYGKCYWCYIKEHCVECSRTSNMCVGCETGYYPYLGKCETCSTKFCLNCDKQRGVCSECYKGYYLSNGECISCSTKIDNCFQCSNNETCLECQPTNYYLKDNKCLQCSNKNNCFLCDAKSDNCLICDYGSFPTALGCTLCTEKQCEKCSQFNGNCTSCLSGYYLTSTNSCEKCADNCITCEGLSQCKQCVNSTFYLSDGICEKCTNKAECIKCSSQSNICEECKSGFYPSGLDCLPCSTKICYDCHPISGKCYSPYLGYFLKNGECLKCSEYIEGCSLCVSELFCTECSSGYFLHENKCSPCELIDHCIDCDRNGTYCLTCEENYFPSRRTCELCSSINCQKCDSSTGVCSLCYSGYTLRNGSCVECAVSHCNKCDSDLNVCDECMPNFMPNKNRVCEYCENGNTMNCARFLCSQTATFRCDECKSGYYLSDSICLPCSPNWCDVCDGTTGRCVRCQTNYYISDGMCLPCNESNSLHCQCNMCSQTEDEFCYECQDGFYLSNGKCLQCSETTNNCSYKSCDKFTGMCTNCNTNYFLSNGKCVLCDSNNPMNCEENHCTLYAQCSSCKNGFYLKSGKCEQCTKTNPGHCAPQKCYSNAENKCYDCDDNYILGDDNKCYLSSEILPNCEKGITRTKCIQCYKGFVLNQNHCTQLSCDYNEKNTSDTVCAGNCKSAISSTISCQSYVTCPKIKLSQTDSLCLLCDINQNLTSNFQCENYTKENCVVSYQDNCLETTKGYFISRNGVNKCTNAICGFDTMNSREESYECSQNHELSYSNTLTCVTKQAHCVKLTTAVIGTKSCEVCQPQHVLLEGNCKTCGENCLTCDANGCLNCTGALLLRKRVCVAPLSERCEIVDPNTNQCVSCSYGYFLDRDGICVVNNFKCEYQTISGCKKCTSLMEEPYYCQVKDPESTTETSGDINLPSSTSDFPKEYNSYKETCYITKSTGCERCKNGFYLDGIYCVKCPQKCLSCYSPYGCTACAQGNYLQNGECVTTEDFEIKCLISLPLKIGCSVCNKKYFRVGISCLPCPSHCNECKSNKTCEICENEHFQSETSRECRPYSELTNCVTKTPEGCTFCSPGFFLQFSECQKCTENCLSCTDSSNYSCTLCEENYVKNTASYKFSCIKYSTIEHCKGSFHSVCIGCYGFYKVMGDGLSCERRSIWTIILGVILITFFVIVVVIIIMFFVVVHIYNERRITKFNAGKIVFKVSHSNCLLNVKIGGSLSSKNKLTFNSVMLPVNKESDDVFVLGNLSCKSLQIQLTVKQEKEPQKCNILVDPQIVVLKKGFACEFKVNVIPMCTCKLHDKILVTTFDIEKSQVKEGQILFDAETEWSTKLDFDEIIEERIVGRGSFGVVYQGLYRSQKVAIKKLKAIHSVDDNLAEFKKEVSMLEKLNNEFIINFYGAVFIPGRVCIVTEFANHGSLFDLLKQDERDFTRKMRGKILYDAARGLEYLHRNDVLHRDVKPDNILVVSLNPVDDVNGKLTDFGSSRNVKNLCENLSLTKCVGTPKFMAPEILQRTVYQKPADVYAFGISVLEVFQRKDPFPVEQFEYPWDIAEFICSGKRPDIFDENENVRNVIEGCWKQSPTERLSISDVCIKLQLLI
ncbi:protein serine/threonine kinase, putative, partial [Entamoeba invadens IP1]